MLSFSLSMFIASNFEQLENAVVPILSTLFGICISVRLVQRLKTPFPISFKVLGNTISVKLPKEVRELFCNYSTPSGIT